MRTIRPKSWVIPCTCVLLNISPAEARDVLSPTLSPAADTTAHYAQNPTRATPASDAERLAELEHEVAALRAQIGQGSAPDSTTCTTCCGDWREEAVAPGLYGGFEFLWVKPHLGQITGIGAQGGDFGFQLPVADLDYEITPRIWLGFTGQSGLGARVRYWQYDHGAGSRLFGPVFLSRDLNVAALDLEFTQDFNWCSAIVTASGGIRYGKVEQGWSVAWYDEIVAGLGRSFEGVGPTLGLDLKRQVCGSGLYVIAGARGSVLFGDRKRVLLADLDEIDEFNGFGDFGLGLGLESEEVLAVTEVRIGLEYQCDIRNCRMFARAAWEGQLWHEACGPISLSDDLGLEGFGVAVGLNR